MVRVKNRYLLVQILYPQDLTAGKSELLTLYQPTVDALEPQVLLRALRATVLELFGDYGAGAVGGSLQVKYLSSATSTFILKVTRDHYRLVWAALSYMTSIPIRDGGKACVFKVVRVSGTIRKAEEEAIRRARELTIRAKKEMGEQSDATLEKLFGGVKEFSSTLSKDSKILDSDMDSEDAHLSDTD